MYWITGILGLAFMVAPYYFGYSDNQAAAWSSWLLGGTAVIASVVEGVWRNHSAAEYWIAATVGLIALTAPFVLGYFNEASAMWMSVGVGAFLAFFAGYKLYFDQKGIR